MQSKPIMPHLSKPPTLLQLIRITQSRPMPRLMHDAQDHDLAIKLPVMSYSPSLGQFPA
jgi:hypothetical protein